MSDEDYVSEPCSNERHLTCKEEYLVLVKVVKVCTCKCHETNVVTVDF